MRVEKQPERARGQHREHRAGRRAGVVVAGVDDNEQSGGHEDGGRAEGER